MIDIFTFITKIGQRIKDYGDGWGSESRLGYSYDNGYDESCEMKCHMTQTFKIMLVKTNTWQKSLSNFILI